MQDWVLKRGTKIVCQIALKRRIQHIHSSHFLVFQISNGCSLWKVASANMQYLLFRGIWHWFFFYLQNPESPRNSPLLSQSRSAEHCEMGNGRWWWGMEMSPTPVAGCGVGPQVCRWLLALYNEMLHGCTLLLRAPHGPSCLTRGGVTLLWRGWRRKM